MIWLWKYPILYHLSCHFGIPLSCTHRIVHKCVKLLHIYLVPKYIKWHAMQEWRNLVGTFPEWPRVVAILDCTPFRISRPKGTCNKINSLFNTIMLWLMIVKITML